MSSISNHFVDGPNGTFRFILLASLVIVLAFVLIFGQGNSPQYRRVAASAPVQYETMEEAEINEFPIEADPLLLE